MLLTIAVGALYALRYADVSRVILGVIGVYGFGIMLANLWNILANKPVNLSYVYSIRHHVPRFRDPTHSEKVEHLHDRPTLLGDVRQKLSPRPVLADYLARIDQAPGPNARGAQGS